MIGHRVSTLQERWKKLVDMANSRKARLEEAVQLQKYYSDASGAESWINEKLSLVNNKDLGRDEQSAKVHLRFVIFIGLAANASTCSCIHLILMIIVVLFVL